jgi:hypothetical protein
MKGTSRSDTDLFLFSWATAGESIRFGAGPLPSGVVLTDASTEIWLHSTMIDGVSWHLDFFTTYGKQDRSLLRH